MNIQANHIIKRILPNFLLSAAIIAVVVFWWQMTPPGLIGKAKAIGSSVCHQIQSHSFKVGEDVFPLCSRCTGMYLGNFIGLVILFTKGKKAGIPSRGIILILILFATLWAADGIKSLLYDLNHVAFLYTPNNSLRLFTGLGMGLSMSSILVPLFNMTMWAKYENKPAIETLPQFCILLVTALFFAFLVLLQNKILLTVFAYITTGTVLVLLTLLYTVLWTLIFKQENSFKKTTDLIPNLMPGFLTTMIQITFFNLMRIALY
ncbi:MAG TPA: DUF2085 domain-containing protein [Anaerolineae bacterium]|nr:DUF2085 domain-containing protein [Anaerolineae bacterium]